MNILEETKFIMKKYAITANKRLGQNFLIDDKAIDAIIESSNISKEDLVIEIGPGLGTLTKYLLEKALTDKINDRDVYMKGIDASYNYEGYNLFSTEELDNN